MSKERNTSEVWWITITHNKYHAKVRYLIRGIILGHWASSTCETHWTAWSAAPASVTTASSYPKCRIFLTSAEGKKILHKILRWTSPEEKFYRSIGKNGIWTHWKSVRKASSKFQELAFKGCILTWYILLTENRIPNSAFFFFRKKILSDYTFSKNKNWSMIYRFKNKR